MVAVEFISLLANRRPAETVATVGRSAESTYQADLGHPESVDTLTAHLPQFDRLLLCHGLLQDTPLAQQSGAQMTLSMTVNLLSTVRLIEHALQANPRMRIAVLGSESGIKGSYDDTYALAKAALHAYVGWRRTGPEQQLVCIAPSMIADTGMTTRRRDQDRVTQRGTQHPKGRLLHSAEVAGLLHHALYEDQGYLTNAVIPLHGGKFASNPPHS
ncbi:SDR family oxidoreductase [Streptomyces sp. NPDC005017]|uniref:SDR family oxidoreductase n=1 Tax=Streptomyces sp. NPDC005017 TaxID=3364706 RepID=UPI0036A59C43